MHRAFAGSRLALTLRRLRGRFGIAAPRLAVRTHVPWYWRALATAVMLAFALALAGWTYDAGRKFAGFDQSESVGEIKSLREKLVALEGESAHLRAIANAGESNLQIERTALARLSNQVKTLEEENVRLKENLAVFENLASGGEKTESISLSGLRIEPDGAPGRYRYRMLAARRGTQAKHEFKASLQLHVTVRQVAGVDDMIVLPRTSDPAADKFAFSFRNFRSVEGTFQIPPEAKIKRVEARLIHEGAVQASQSVSL
jgi:hypothetical protein